MSSQKVLIVHTDGASRGNPGDAAIGVAISDKEGNLLQTHKEYLGKHTNNYAEYAAIVKSVDILQKIETGFDKIEFYSDSELMVNQLTGRYIIRNESLKNLSLKFMKEMKILGKPYEIKHVRREDNKDADKLANEALDKALKQKT